MNEEYTKISITTYGETISWEVNHSDIDINEAINGFVSCLLGATFHKDTIKAGMHNYIENA